MVEFNDLDTGSCFRFRDGTGLDQLGCGYAFTGILSGPEYLLLVNFRFDRPHQDSSRINPLFGAVNWAGQCERDADLRADIEKPQQIREYSFRNWGKADLDRDGLPDLVVVVGIRDYGKFDSLREACTNPAPDMQVYKLVFVLRDQGLMPTEATRKILEKYGDK